MVAPAERPVSPSSHRDKRLDEAVARYLLAAEAGRAPDRARFIEQHPDLAGDLASFFDDEDHLKRLAGSMPVRAQITSGGASDSRPGAERDHDLRVGGAIGDFELLEEIAAGGMGVIFKARQKSLNRIVALKTIRPGALRPGDDAARRFRIEAEAVARLDHPGIVPIYEMGEHRGYPFLCLKLVEGGDLEKHLDRLRSDPAATARVMADVARAVDYAHRRGVLHRDLKPSNILIDTRGRPHVTDFGLARCLEADSRMTQTGLILGTPSFMAPEQVAGPRGEVTTAADVYGLGAVMYTVLTGRPPFHAGTVYETLHQVREQEPQPPAASNQAVDRDLEAICLKCLEKDPRRRYASAKALAIDLERWLVGEPIAARPAGRVERARRWYRRNRLIAHVSAGVAALIVASAAIAGLAAVGYYQQAEHAVRAARNERVARVLADARAEDIRNRLVRIAVASGTRLMEQGDATGALPWFAEALMFDRADPRAAEMHRLRLGTLFEQCPSLEGVFTHVGPIQRATVDRSGRRLAAAGSDGTARVWDIATGGPLVPPLAHGGPVHDIEFRTDGSRLLTASEDGAVRIWDLDIERSAPAPALRMNHGSPVRFAAYARDGRLVVSAGADGTLRVWDAGSGRPVGVTHRLDSALADLAVSQDGRVVAAAPASGKARVWRLDTAGLHEAITLRSPSSVRRVGLSPGGGRLVTVGDDGAARIWNPLSGEPLSPPIVHGQRVTLAAFSPDGSRLVTAATEGTARVWDVRTGQPIGPGRSAIGHAIGIVEVAFSPDGGRLVTAGLDGTARIWDVASGSPLSPPFYHGGSPVHAHFTPEGYQVLTYGSDAIARLWNVTDVGGSAIVIEGPGGVEHAAFDRSGRQIATAGEDGAARVWNAATGEPISPPLVHRGPVTRVAFSPDGRWVATAGEDGTARVWHVERGRPVTYALAHDGAVRDLLFTPDGTRLATASADGRARIWDVATGRAAVSPMDHDAPVAALAFSGDGRWLATASDDGMARVWDVASGQPALAPLPHHTPVGCVAFRPDGRALLAACPHSGLADVQALQWDLTTARPLGVPLKHGDGVFCAIYSPDGRRIATASADRTARVWDAATGEPITRPLTHQHQVLMVTFSLDGRRLATCSLDGTARVWDAETGEPLSPPLAHRDRTRVGVVAFRPDGLGLLTAGMDGTARVWSLPRDDRPSDVLVLHSQVLAGRRIDQTGGEIPLRASELSDAWARLRGTEPVGRTSPSRSRTAWHRREAHRLELARQGVAAAWHLERLLELSPNDRTLTARLAAARALPTDSPGGSTQAGRGRE